MPDHDLLTTAEVADYLRLKQRKVYDLVSQGQIPCSRVTGKLLFPRQAIDLWLLNHMEGDQRTSRPIPPVVAGSNDPLLEWALREAGVDLAQLCNGSGDGVRRLLDGQAMVAGLHLVDQRTGAYNNPLHCGLGGMRDLVIIHWARRRQGLLLPPGNPLGVSGLADLAQRRLRVSGRQPGAGAQALLEWLLEGLGLHAGALNLNARPALSEDDLALDVREGRADCGLAVEASGLRHGLEFIPLHTEHFDLAMRRRSYFEPAVQRLLRFCRSERFGQRAAAMGGYAVEALGDVVYNA